MQPLACFIDYGIPAEHPEDEVIPFSEPQYRQRFAEFERFDVAAEIERIRRKAGAW